MTNIILCGRTHEIGDVVMEMLKPEYEGMFCPVLVAWSDGTVVRFIMTPEQGIAEIPSLLKGDKPIFAILAGGGFNDEEFAKVKEAADAAGCKAVPWLRPDKTKPRPADPMSPEYAKVVGQRSKDGLKAVEGVTSGEVFWY